MEEKTDVATFKIPMKKYRLNIDDFKGLNSLKTIDTIKYSVKILSE